MRPTAKTLGMNVSVISWICVTACSTDTSRPTPSETASVGSASSSATVIVRPMQGLQKCLRHVWNPATRLCVRSAQPSTSTNSRILNGSEIRAGGSIIMPIDMSVDEITRSMIRNGM